MDEKGAHLHETVRAFAAFVEALPASAVRPTTWGPREVLSHLVFWHETSSSFNELNCLAVARLEAAGYASP